MIRFTLHSRRRQGFSLIELVAATAIAGILALALGSALTVASKTLTLDRSTLAAQTEASEAINQIQTELAAALDFQERTATAITFTVPDRTGDDSEDLIRYEWTGSTGNPAPLTRQFNNGDVVTLVANVQDFDLTFLTKIVDGRPPPGPPPPQESDEMLLASYEFPSGDGDALLKNFPVSLGDYVGQYFNPAMPANALSYKVTRIKFRVRQTGGKGNMIVRVYEPNDSNLPAASLEAYVQKAATLPGSYTWMDYSFTTLTDRVPGTGLILALESDKSGSSQYEVEYVRDANTAPDQMKVYAGSWGSNTKPSDMLFEVYGTITSQGPLPE